MVDCPRCYWINAAPPQELVLFWQPGRSEAQERLDGERIRALALAGHAAAGHEDSDDDRRAFAAKTKRLFGTLLGG